ncbi:MAG: flagellar biosynthesis protein FlhF [Deltaproteobacteria bacterium CG23_combo_of_CG06-09_8_20_14_all_60_8]|nr:MAG: hypothetical protein AUK28_11120 [Desulfobacterales bacterium CG2_30_60_27]PIP42801.1 MAG: flagellar biosynthesis protein FlhF [Deltaproteobacteria bacterium CG23_combo_of_CG06-09_8_20_14_all_60_8]
MKIRRFVAQDAKTALAMVKKELGPDAVILATRTIKRKPDNRQDGPALFRALDSKGRNRVEVVAATDYEMEELGAALEQPDAPSPATPPRPTPPRRLHTEAQELRSRFASLLTEQTGPAGHQPMATKPGRQRPNPEQVARWRDRVIGEILITPMAPTDEAGPLTVALVGATGVGKTTTIAKLAAWFTLRERKKVALISMDSYRIGATDQLRTYGRIMRLPCEIALKPEELALALARHRDKDVILIDTAGKSPYDTSNIVELEEWFAPCAAIAPYLVLNATAQKENHARVIGTYSRLGLRGLVLTKLDETQAYAGLCQEVATSALPVACLCTGQRVPEDFQMASRPFLEKLVNQGHAAFYEQTASSGQRSAFSY